MTDKVLCNKKCSCYKKLKDKFLFFCKTEITFFYNLYVIVNKANHTKEHTAKENRPASYTSYEKWQGMGCS